MRKDIKKSSKEKVLKEAIPLLAEEGWLRRAKAKAQTGWSVRLQILFDCFQDEFDVVAHVAIFKSEYSQSSLF